MLKKFTLISFILTIILSISCIVMGVVGFKDTYTMIGSYIENLSIMQTIEQRSLPENSIITVNGNAVENIKFTISSDNSINIISDDLGSFSRATSLIADENQPNVTLNLATQPINWNIFSLTEDAKLRIVQSLFGYALSNMEVQIPASATLVITENVYEKSNLGNYDNSYYNAVYIDPSISVQMITNF